MDSTRDVNHLIKNMSPKVNEGDYVFCVLGEGVKIAQEEIVVSIVEKEGKTVVVAVDIAIQKGLPFTSVMSWITLNVHSSLEAVGLTALVSNALAKEDISCNIVAGYYHDHIFVLKEDKENALNALNDLSKLIRNE